MTRPVGFIGLGHMGEAIALRLCGQGIPLVVWNRTVTKAASLSDAGADVAQSVEEVFVACETIFLMLASQEAIDAVLGRGSDRFIRWMNDRTIVHMGTTAAAYSQQLEQDVRAAGGRYVESPVSGSRKPAENGQLVTMVAGDKSAIAALRPFLAIISRQIVECGSVPNASLMKLAVNVYLITMVTGLAEAFHFARRHELDLRKFEEVLGAGPMSSDVMRMKLAKLIERDFTPHAAISDVLKNASLVAEQARIVGIASPLLDVCRSLYAETEAQGLGREDMAAVQKAIDQRSAQPTVQGNNR